MLHGVGRVRLEVFNAKTEAISGVMVVPISDNLRLSPSTYFIGSMDPDDVFSASFNLYTSDLEIDEIYDIGFKVKFKQGENYYETSEVSSIFKVVKPEKKEKSNLTYNIAIVVVIAIILLLVINYFRRRRIPK